MSEAVHVEVDVMRNGTVTVKIGPLSHDRHTGLSQAAASDLLVRTAQARGPLMIVSRYPDAETTTELMRRDGTLEPVSAAARQRVQGPSATSIFTLDPEQVSHAEAQAQDPGWSSVQERFVGTRPAHQPEAEPARENPAQMLAVLGVPAAGTKTISAGRAQPLDTTINEGRDRYGRLIVEDEKPAAKDRSPARVLAGMFSGASTDEPGSARPERTGHTLDTLFGGEAVGDAEQEHEAEQRPRRSLTSMRSRQPSTTAAPEPAASEVPSALSTFDPEAVSRRLAETKAQSAEKVAAEKARAQRSTRIRNISLIVTGAITLMSIVAIAVAQLLGGGDKTGVDYTEVQALTVGEPVKVLPGYGEDAAWDRKISEDAAVTAFPEAVVVAQGKKLELFATEDGEPIRTINTDEAVEYSFSATVGDRQMLGFKTGSKLVLWPADAGAKGNLVEVDLTNTGVPLEELKVTAAGKSLLIRDEAGTKNWTVTDKGLVRLHSTLAGQTLMAVDGDQQILSSLGSTSAYRTELDGSAPRKTDLQAPAEDLESMRWITAGSGRAVVAWAASETSEEWALTVHDLEDGSVIATVPVTAADTEKKTWVRGVGRDTAAFGPYLFSMVYGTLLTDGSDLGVDFTKVYGPYGQAITTDGLAYAVEDTIYPSQSQLLSVADDTAIVMTDATTISSYQRTSGEV